MHLSQNQKIFSQLLCAIFKCPLNFQHFLTKMTLIAFVFPKSRTPKTWLDKCLKSPFSEAPSTGNMVIGPKH